MEKIPSKKYVIYALCICLAFAYAVIQAFQYLPDNSEQERSAATINVPADETEDVQQKDDNKEEQVAVENTEEETQNIETVETTEISDNIPEDGTALNENSQPELTN